MCVVRSGSSARKDGSGSTGYAVMRRLRGCPLGAARVNEGHRDGTDVYFLQAISAHSIQGRAGELVDFALNLGL